MRTRFTKAPEKCNARKEKRKSRPIGSGSARYFCACLYILLFVVAPLFNEVCLSLSAGASALAADANLWETIKAYVWEIKPDSWVAFNLIDGLIRMLFFVVMIFTMSYQKDIRRVFEYHGAEHKTVINWEKGLDLTVENASIQKRQHPRCGTSFLMVVRLVAIVCSRYQIRPCGESGRAHRAMPSSPTCMNHSLRGEKESGGVFKFMTLPNLAAKHHKQEPDTTSLRSLSFLKSL